MKFTDVELLKYCDGDLEQHRANLIETAVLEDKVLAQKIDVLNASNLPYKEAFSAEQIPELPKALSDNIRQLIDNKTQSTVQPADQPAVQAPNAQVNVTEKTVSEIQKPPLLKKLYANGLGVGMAASLALCFFIGYFVANLTIDINNDTLSLASNDQASWVRRVADYQTLYVENTVSSITPNTVATTALLKKIEQDTQMKTAVPDLSEHGYNFVRAQELGYQSSTLIQLVYYKSGKAPLAFCFMPANGDKPTDLNIGEREGLRTADWIQGGQRFVIVGSESPEVMQSLYESAQESWEI